MSSGSKQQQQQNRRSGEAKSVLTNEVNKLPSSDAKSTSTAEEVSKFIITLDDESGSPKVCQPKQVQKKLEVVASEGRGTKRPKNTSDFDTTGSGVSETPKKIIKVDDTIRLQDGDSKQKVLIIQENKPIENKPKEDKVKKDKTKEDKLVGTKRPRSSLQPITTLSLQYNLLEERQSLINIFKSELPIEIRHVGLSIVDFVNVMDFYSKNMLRICGGINLLETAEGSELVCVPESESSETGIIAPTKNVSSSDLSSDLSSGSCSSSTSYSVHSNLKIQGRWTPIKNLTKTQLELIILQGVTHRTSMIPHDYIMQMVYAQYGSKLTEPLKGRCKARWVACRTSGIDWSNRFFHALSTISISTMSIMVTILDRYLGSMGMNKKYHLDNDDFALTVIVISRIAMLFNEDRHKRITSDDLHRFVKTSKTNFTPQMLIDREAQVLSSLDYNLHDCPTLRGLLEIFIDNFKYKMPFAIPPETASKSSARKRPLPNSPSLIETLQTIRFEPHSRKAEQHPERQIVIVDPSATVHPSASIPPPAILASLPPTVLPLPHLPPNTLLPRTADISEVPLVPVTINCSMPVSTATPQPAPQVTDSSATTTPTPMPTIRAISTFSSKVSEYRFDLFCRYISDLVLFSYDLLRKYSTVELVAGIGYIARWRWCVSTLNFLNTNCPEFNPEHLSADPLELLAPWPVILKALFSVDVPQVKKIAVDILKIIKSMNLKNNSVVMRYSDKNGSGGFVTRIEIPEPAMLLSTYLG